MHFSTDAFNESYLLMNLSKKPLHVSLDLLCQTTESSADVNQDLLL